MTSILIGVLFVAVVCLALVLISYTPQHSKDIEYLKARDKSLRKAFNEGANRGNEHLRAFKEFADLMGYCVHETHEVKFSIASVFGDEEPKHIKKLVVHKKEAPAPVRKLKVKEAKPARRKVIKEGYKK